MIVSYAWLVRTVGPNRLRRVLSYVQFLLSFVVYGGFFALSRVFQVGVIGQFSLPKSMWMLLLPPAWFASYLEIAAGRITALDIALAGASVVALVGVTLRLGGKLSLEYADRLAAITTAAPSPSRKRTARLRRWCSRGRKRAPSRCSFEASSATT